MKRMDELAVPVLAFFLAASSVASAQSLAEAARRERERRDATPDTPVITNETIARTSPSGSAPTPPITSTDSAASPQTATEKIEPKSNESKERGEAWWRKAFADARESVRRADLQTQLLERQLNETQTEFLIRNDIFNKEGQMVPILNQLKSDLEAARARAAAARKAVADLEDDLRRSGGLPGWSR